MTDIESGWVTLSNIQDWDIINDPQEQRRLARIAYWQEKYKENRDDASRRNIDDEGNQKHYKYQDGLRHRPLASTCKNGHSYAEGSYKLNIAGARMCLRCKEERSLAQEVPASATE